MADARTAADGDKVLVHYTGTLDNGDVFDSSREGDPLSFSVGGGQVIDGFDAAVRGLAVGASHKFRIEPDDAYGQRDESQIISMPAEQAPDGLGVGDQVQLGDQPAVVTAVGESEVTVDANHPLAGEALTFDIEVMAID